MDDVDDLRRQIAQRESEVADLRIRLAAATQSHSHAQATTRPPTTTWSWPLEEHDYLRYGRQMIVPNFGLDGQLSLKRAKVLLVGAGGLGCPAAAYLAGAGVGLLGLVDGDEVEVSNLHRQVAHATERVGMSKVESVVAYLKGLNPTIAYQAHHTHLTPQNAEAIVSRYDLVLDCTDHPTSRYLISDICVLLGRPLVSASAFQTSGQLVVLNDPPGKGPCYRCLFPKPPPPESVVGCGEGGIVGPVVGVMGVLQALEAIKLIIRGGLGDKDDIAAPPRPTSMLLFSGMTEPPFRSVRMRGRRPDCIACSSALTLEKLASSMDYVAFCGVNRPVRLLKPEDRVTPQAFHEVVEGGANHVLIDVRGKEHYGLASIPGSINVPIGLFTSRGECLLDSLPDASKQPGVPVFVVCREGNDSQVAVTKLKELGLESRDILGGLRAWKANVDGSLPFL